LDRPCGYGVNVAGTGHVVCYNAISGFWDNLNVNTNCHPDPKFERPAISIDFYNNDLTGECGDNPGEADGSVRNVRFLRNLGSFTCQPIWGGPVYFIRNFGGPEKMVTGPSGVVAYHNVASVVSSYGPDPPPSRNWIGRLEFLNNEIHGVNVGTFSRSTLLDYNAYINNRTWRYASPVASVSTTEFQEFRAKTGQEVHGFTIDAGQSVPHKQALAADSPLIDKACVLPNVNDDFTGEAPDIGPYESGRPLPHYGPRPD
jgi:hypothetical protein